MEAVVAYGDDARETSDNAETNPRLELRMMEDDCVPVFKNSGLIDGGVAGILLFFCSRFVYRLSKSITTRR